MDYQPNGQLHRERSRNGRPCPVNPNDIYIKSTEEGRYTVVYGGKDFKDRDYTDVIAVICYSEGRKIHVFDPDYAGSKSDVKMLFRTVLGEPECEGYLKWLRRRAGST